MEQYIINGRIENVRPENVADILRIYPNARKVSSNESKTTVQEGIFEFDDGSASYKLDEDGRRMYYTKAAVGFESKKSNKPRYVIEVGYDYDRSKGIRYEADSYGKYIDNFAYKYLAPIINVTADAIKSSQSGEYTDEMNEFMMRGGDRNITQEEARKTIKLLEESSKKEPSKKRLLKTVLTTQEWLNSLKTPTPHKNKKKYNRKQKHRKLQLQKK